MIFIFIRNKFLGSLLFVAISISGVYGQKALKDGYIITLSNDTIMGLLEDPINKQHYELCNFSKSGVTTSYTPQQILGYGYSNGIQFNAKIVKNYFVEVLVTGRLDLYKLNNSLLLRKEEKIYPFELLQDHLKQFEGLKVIEDNNWKFVTANLISDRIDSPNELLKSFSLTTQDLSTIAMGYNQIDELGYSYLIQSFQRQKLIYGIFIGWVNSSISLDDPDLEFPTISKEYSSYDPTFGIGIEYIVPHTSRRLAFQMEAHYTIAKYSSLLVIEDNRNVEFHETLIKLNTISIPASIKYTIPIKRYSLSAHLGINYDINLKAEATLLSEIIERGSIVYTYKSTAFGLSNHEIGYLGAVALSRTYKNVIMSLILRYTHLRNISESESLTATNKKFSVSVIIYKK